MLDKFKGLIGKMCDQGDEVETALLEALEKFVLSGRIQNFSTAVSTCPEAPGTIWKSCRNLSSIGGDLNELRKMIWSRFSRTEAHKDGVEPCPCSFIKR